MDVSSGIFTAPRRGTYSFAISALVYFGANLEGDIDLDFYLNNRVVNYGHAHGTSHDQTSIHTTLNLQAGDRMWTEISHASNTSCVLDRRYVHFTGWQLQEEPIFPA